MDLLQNYADQKEHELDETEDQNNQNPNSLAPSSPKSPPPHLLPSKSSARKVYDTVLALTVSEAWQTQSRPIDPTQHVVNYNPTYEQLWIPVHDPAHPYAKDGIAQGMRNHKLGFVEDASVDSFVFYEQYNTFHKYGYSADNNYIGDLDALQKHDGVSGYNMPQ